MKRLIIPLLLLMSVFAFGQNNGQSAENNAVKIQYVGNHKVRIINKQDCYATIYIKYLYNSWWVTLASGAYYEITTNSVGEVEAKATTKCHSWYDQGWLEFQITATILPVKFVSLKATPLGNNKVQVDFEIAEATNVNKFVVQVSFDGINWRDVGIVLPDNVQPNRLYSIKLDLSTQKQTK